MKKIVILSTIVFMGFSTFAQLQRKVAGNNEKDSLSVNEQVTKGDNAKKTDRKKLLKELNLTKEQRLKLKEMQQANKSKREDILNNDALTEDQKQEKLKEIRKTAASDLKGILSDEQKIKMKAMRKDKGKTS